MNINNKDDLPKKRISVEERKHYILSFLDQNGSVTVSELSKYFGISEVSVRKLLISLEKSLLLQRTWGGAIKPIGAMKELSYQARETKHLAEKIAIAKVAYDFIEDGDAIYLDSGTTTYELVKLIREGPKRNILIATNAIDHAVMLIGQSDLSIILVGGEIRHNNRSCSGYLTKDTISQMVFDKGFIGIEHVSIDHGLTTPNMRDAELKRTIINSSKQCFVLADHSKFWNDSLIQVAPSEKIYRIITDWHATQEEVNHFNAKGIKLLFVEQYNLTS